MSKKQINTICEAIRNNSVDNLGDLLTNFTDISNPIIQLNEDTTGEKIFDVEIFALPPNEKCTILHYAAFYNSLDIFKYLENEKKLPLRIPSELGLLPLHYACAHGSSDVALYILGKDPEQAKIDFDNKDIPSLLYLSIRGKKSDVL